MKDARAIIRRALITEKGARLREQNNVYQFEVDPAANKIEVRRAIEEIFDVKVTRVRTINFAGKPKRLGRHSGYRSSWKKAIVTLAAGQTIEIFEQV